MKKEALMVILAAKFKENVEQGWFIEIECMEPPWKYGSTYRGIWRMFCVSPDRSERMVLVMKKNIEPREFLSVHGVVAFLVDMGVALAIAPMIEGQRVAVNKDCQVELVARDGM